MPILLYVKLLKNGPFQVAGPTKQKLDGAKYGNFVTVLCLLKVLLIWKRVWYNREREWWFSGKWVAYHAQLGLPGPRNTTYLFENIQLVSIKS
jgi:hypothetical protein